MSILTALAQPAKLKVTGVQHTLNVLTSLKQERINMPESEMPTSSCGWGDSRATHKAIMALTLTYGTWVVMPLHSGVFRDSGTGLGYVPDYGYQVEERVGVALPRRYHIGYS